MGGPIILTDAEKEAKEIFNLLTFEGTMIPIDSGNISDINMSQPDWIDFEKFKRGQEYFKENRFGILSSNLYGLFCLLTEPKGLNILINSNKSSTPESAKLRYVSTTLHMLSWYEMDLSPGSESWKSLLRVRKLHLSASNAARKREDGIITQTEVAATVFGFMGFALLKPHILGIRNDNRQNVEGFVHFWAVMLFMIGVEDRFNFCTQPLEVVENVCLILQRYVFMPLLQFESPKFKQMATAMINGMKHFIPVLSYESQLFLARRACGIPGYQYDVDLNKEKICRDIYSKEEIEKMRSFLRNLSVPCANSSSYISHEIILYDVQEKFYDASSSGEFDVDDNQNITGTYTKLDENGDIVVQQNLDEDKHARVKEYLELDDVEIVDRIISYNDYKSQLNGSKFETMSFVGQRKTKFACRIASISKYWFFRKSNEWSIQKIINWERDWLQKRSIKGGSG